MTFSKLENFYAKFVVTDFFIIALNLMKAHLSATASASSSASIEDRRSLSHRSLQSHSNGLEVRSIEATWVQSAMSEGTCSHPKSDNLSRTCRRGCWSETVRNRFDIGSRTCNADSHFFEKNSVRSFWKLEFLKVSLHKCVIKLNL